MQFLCVTNAQTNFIEGRILDSNHIPISSASIKVLLNDSTGLIKYFTLSDKDGFFKIELKPNTSKLWLQVSVVGFINYNQALLFPIQNGYQEIILQKFTGTLPAINVKAELPITKRGDTTIFKVAAFEKGNENNLGDLLKNLPGISLDEFGKVSFNGKKITRILIEEDDLFGSNYSTLTKNTGISGLDKIEVIENYKDNSRLENSANVGNETVLNLKYKTKKIRLFGNNFLGVGLPLKFYETKNNVVGLLGKNKFVTTINKNSVGNLASLIVAGSNRLLNNENERVPLNIQFLDAPVQFSDILPLNIKPTRLFSNNSTLITINHLIKASKKISIKNNIVMFNDIYNQTFSTIETVNNSLLPITLQQENGIEKNNLLYNFNTEVNWKLNSKLQTILQYSLNSTKDIQQNSGYLFLKPVTQKLNELQNQHRLNLVITKVIGSSSILTTQIFYNNFKLNHDYIIQNSIVDTSFKIDSSLKNINQQYSLSSNVFAAELRYSKWSKILKYSINIITSKQNSYLLNHTFAFEKFDSLVMLSNNYNANMNLTDLRNSFNVSVTNNSLKKITLTANLQLQHINLSLFNNKIFLRDNFQKAFILLSINTQYKLNDKNILLGGLQQQVYSPTVQQLNNTNTFISLTSFNKGSNQFSSNVGFTANLGYLFFDVLNSGVFFNTFIFMSNTPPNYISNFTGRGLLTYNELFPFNKKNQFITIASRFEKKIHPVKSSITVMVNYTTSKQYFNTNNLLTFNKGTTALIETKLNTNWNKGINISTSINYRYQRQHSYIENLTTNKFVVTDIVSKVSINVKLLKKILLDFDNDFFVNKPQYKTEKKLFFSDITIKYKLTKKLDIGVVVKNLFNNNAFQQNVFSTIQNSLDTFYMLPIYTLFSFQYKF